MYFHAAVSRRPRRHCSSVITLMLDYVTRLQRLPLSLQAPHPSTPPTETVNRVTLIRNLSVLSSANFINSTRKIVRWFEELINSNDLTFFYSRISSKTGRKDIQKHLTISLALMAARSVFHPTLRLCDMPIGTKELAIS